MKKLSDWWSVDSAGVIEKLNKDLCEARKMADLWKRAYEELDIAARELVDTVISVKTPLRK